MKIQESVHRVYQGAAPTRPAVQRPEQAPSATRQPAAPTGRKQIPRNFQPKVGLNQKEQAFFTRLFPAQKRQIAAYVQQQNKTVPQKGQIIDMKG